MKTFLTRLLKLSKTPFTWRWYLFSCRWFGVKLHWIRPVEDEWHTHPWNGFSVIFGSYEERTTRDGTWKRKRLFNFIGANKEHQTRGNCMTLFFHGPRVNENWYWGDEVRPWKGPQNV